MENIIRAALSNQQITTATRLWSTDPVITELTGVIGKYDYIEFVAEYSAFTQKDLENIVRAAEVHQMGSMIKVDFLNRGYTAQKAVASGFQAILFSDHRTPEEVRESVSMIKPMAPGYDGLYGFPTRRFIGMDHRASQTAHIKRTDDIVLCFMIEKGESMENLEEILSVPGVDMVQFGPSDYSMSMGWNRSEHVEEMKAVERQMIAAALRHGVRPRCEINSAAEAAYYKDLGVMDFSLGDEVRILENYWRAEGEALEQIVRTKG